MSIISSQKKLGVMFSYMYTLIQIIISFIFTPFLIKTLGSNDYGIYQMVSSFATGLAIMNFGISIIMSRNITRFRFTKDNDGLENTLYYGMFITLILSIVIAIFGIVLSLLLEPLYGKSLNEEELMKAYIMYFILVVQIVVIVWQSYFSGIIIGYEKFAFTNLMKVISQVIRVIIIIILINLGFKVVSIVVADVTIALLTLVIDIFYCKKKFNLRVKKHYSDKVLLNVMIMFGFASLFQSIIKQINLTLDKVVIGSMMSASDVTIYSIALLVISSSITMTKVFASVFLPDATKIVIENGTKEQLTNLVVKPGRYQAIIMFGILFGFITIGKEFLELWVGEDFVTIWIPTIFMLVPVSFMNIISTADVILDAKLKKMLRSIILGMTAVINLVITIVLVPKFGIYGAAIGTATSYILGNLIFLNLYYIRKINIDIILAYKEILKGIFPCALLTGIVIWGLKKYLKFNLNINFFILAFSFILIYFILLYLFGLNKKEKRALFSLLTIIKFHT